MPAVWAGVPAVVGLLLSDPVRESNWANATRLMHGQRRTYQDGCSCTPCRAAEAAYRADLRRRRVLGRTPLGAHISAVEAWRKIRAMKREGYRLAELAAYLGLKSRIPRLQPDRITVRNHVKVRRLYRVLVEGQPAEAS
jgi:hypothetical protein